MDRVEQMVPEKIRQLSGRKLYAILLGVLGVLVVLSIIFGALVGVKHVKDSGNTGPRTGAQKGRNWNNPGLCLDSACLHTSSWMTENMDTTVNPCDNFYKYSCGGWIRKNSIPPDWTLYSVNSKLWHQTDAKIRKILTSRIKDQSQGSTERKLKEFYKTCIHDYGRMKEGGKVMVDIIKNRLGGWYALDADNWQENGWDANSALTVAISDYWIDALFRVDVSRRRSKNLITLRYGGLGMYEDEYHDEDLSHVQQAYKDYIHEVGRLLMRDANVTIDNDALQQFVDDVYYQESHIARHMLALQDAGNFYQSTVTTIREMSTNYTQLNWLQIIRADFGPGVTYDTEIYLTTKPYFEMIDQLLRNESENKNRILNNYLVWSFAHGFGYQLSWEYKFAGYKFYKALTGQTGGMSTMQSCAYRAEYLLGLALGSQFVSMHVDNATYYKVNQLFDQLKQSYIKTIDDFSWMDNVTQSNTKTLISEMDAMIGLPPNFFDKAYIDELHVDLVINKSLGYFTNLLNTIRFLKKTMQMELNSGPHFYKWHFILHRGAFGVRPFYFWGSNHMVIPAGVMQFPFFQNDQPMFADIGGLGADIASVIFRGLRGNGMYSRYGKYKWTNNSITQIRNVENCYKNMTTELKAGPYTVNGEQVTLSPKLYSAMYIVPDIVAAKVTFNMYQRYQEENGPEKFPPGLNLTSNQAFFVSMAQMNCAKVRDEDAYNTIQAGRLTKELTVNIALSQTQEFSDAFKCAADSKMNAKKKCSFF